MKLIDFLLTAFEVRWNTRFSVNSFGSHTSFKEFIRDVKYFLVMLKNIRDSYGTNVKVAILAENSMDYISCYLALIFSQLSFTLIPIKTKVTSIRSIISTDEINFIFTNVDLPYLRGLPTIPWFKGIVDIREKHYNILRSEHNFFDNEKIITLREMICEHFRPRNRKITVFSSGVDKIYPQAVEFNSDTVYEGLIKLCNTELLPVIENKKIHCDIDYAYAPVWSMLWPLVNGGVFAETKEHANVLLDSSNSFEEKWNYVTEEIYEKKFIGKLLMKSWLYWLFRMVARYYLKQYLNSGTKKDAIIILNAFLSPRIMKTIAYYLPVYTTYGMQECNHILAINDYSTSRHEEHACVGQFIEGVGGDVKASFAFANEGSLTIVSTALSPNLSYEKDVWWDTRDHASLNNNLLFIYGKMRYVIKTHTTEGANFENVERVLKNIPYFKDVMAFDDNEGNHHLMVYPNAKVIEAMKYGLMDFMKLIEPYVGIVNTHYGLGFLSDIKIVFYDFLRSHNGKIQKGWYQAITNQSIEES